MTIRAAHSRKPIPKKSAETILTKLLTINGKDVVSAINPLAIINGNMTFLLNPRLRPIAKTIGVNIKAAPSFAKNAATIEPNNIIKINIFNPLPFEARTTCLADHSKKPISSKINEIKITATNVNVAFHTIDVTSSTSEKLTTPVIIAMMAPISAVIPISKPLGCQITNIKVTTKIQIAKISIISIQLIVYFYKHMKHRLNESYLNCL